MSNAIHKIAFLGEPGAGKTTSIAAISDIDVISTDVGCTDDLLQRKATTTVAFDYGELDLGAHGKLLLYGMPGQSRFTFMLDIVSDGLVSIIVLVDATSETGLAGLDEVLTSCSQILRQVPFVLGLNKRATANIELRRDCLNLLRHHGLVAPILSIDARLRTDVVRLTALLFCMLEHSPIQQHGVQAWG